MKYSVEQMNGGSGVVDPLDDVCLSTNSREHAKAVMRKADLVADVVIRIVAELRVAVAWCQRVGTHARRRSNRMHSRSEAGMAAHPNDAK